MYNLPQLSSELTKSQISLMATLTASELQNDGNLLNAIDVMTKMEYLIKEIKSNVNFIDAVRDEISKYGKEYKSSTGTKIELAEVGTKYNYLNCNDTLLNSLLADEEVIKNKIKERESFLKSLPFEGLETITADGEVVKLYPPSKTSTSSIKTTLPK